MVGVLRDVKAIGLYALERGTTHVIVAIVAFMLFAFWKIYLMAHHIPSSGSLCPGGRLPFGSIPWF